MQHSLLSDILVIMASKGRGKVQMWIAAYAADPPITDACIPWSFYRDSHGYAQARNPCNQRQEGAYRILWEAVYKIPFPPDKEARHTCGNGNQGCVNHLHCIPGTPVENSADKIRHETDNRGQRCASSKLTEAQVTEIRNRVQAGEKQSCLAREFGVTPSNISHLIRGVSWRWLA